MARQCDKITSKTKFLRMWIDGAFGNRPRVWRDLQDVMADDYEGAVSVRSYRVGSRWFKAGLLKSELPAYVGDLHSKGVGPHEIYYGESPDMCNITLQGELLHCGPSGAEHLTYSFGKCSLRDAMRESPYVSGLGAKMLMKKFMCPNSYCEISNLAHKFSDHVIEFTCYNHWLGIVPRRNTVVWEVRYY